MDIKRIEYNILDGKEDITLSQWVQYVNIAQEENIDPDFLQSKRLEIFAAISLEEAMSLPQVDIDSIEYHIDRVINEENKFVTSFEFNGIEYGFIPDFNKFITTRELVDSTFYLEQKDHVRLLSILYRPIVLKDGDKYRIDKYTETHTLFKDLRYDIYEGSMGFFLRTLNQLGKATLKFIEGELDKTNLTSAEKHNLLKSMEDIQNWYTSLQVVM